MNLRAMTALLGLVIAAYGCSSGSGTAAIGNDGGAGGGGGPVEGCGDATTNTIAGNWDLLSTGNSTHVKVSVDATSFTFVHDVQELAFKVTGGTMSLVWREPTPVPITVAQTTSALDVGVLPLAVGGDWLFSSADSTQSCKASVRAAALTASCNGVQATPLGALSGTMIGERTTSLPSLFGDLGGVWHLASGRGSIDVTVSRNEFKVVSNGLGNLSGHPLTLDVKICNGTLTGTTSDGAELAGTRQ
jgi:hypothetical protein